MEEIVEELLTNRILAAVKNRNAKELKEIFEVTPNIDIAEALDEVDDAAVFLYIFRTVNSEYTSDFFTELTNEQQIDTCTTISGFYIVTQVEHSFNSSGKFTQKITAVIDPMSTVRSDYEDASLDSIDGTVLEKQLSTTSNYIPRAEMSMREVTAMGQSVRPVNNVKDILNKNNWNKYADIGQSTTAGQALSIDQTLLG